MRKRSSVMVAFATVIVAMIAALGAMSPASAKTDVSVASAKQVAMAKKSTMDCNGVSYQYSGYSYGWGNNRNRVIYGLGSGGNIRAVKIYADGISSATWSIGVISQSGATVESSGTGPTYCVGVPATTKGVVLTSRYNGSTVRIKIDF